MKTRSKTFFTLILAASFLVIFILPAAISLVGVDIAAEQVYAQESYKFLEPIPGVGEDIDVSNDFADFVQTVIAFVIGLTILASVIMIVAAGFQYLTSVSQDKTSEAKQTIQNAVLGLLLALASVVILQTINPQLIELKSVDTVTTSGSSLDIPGSGDWVIDSGTRCLVDDIDCYAGKSCFPFISQGNFDFFDEETAYLCFQYENQCEEGQVEQTDLTEEFARGNEIENPRETAEDVIGSCRYYYKSTGQILHTETSPETVLQNITGIDTSKEGAKNRCENQGRDVAYNNYEECLAVGNDGTPQFDFDSCDVTCDTPQDKPKPLPDNWNEEEWCSTDDPSASDCFDEKPICESVHGDCYRSPISMTDGNGVGQYTACDNCVFINRSNYPVKAVTCSPDEQNPNQCRIDSGLANSLTQIEQFLNPPTAPDPLNYQITETFPPTVKHKSGCHYDGTCVDVGLRKDGDEIDPGVDNNRYQNTAADGTEKHAKKINMFIQAAEEYGLRAEYEVGSMELMSRLIDHGVDPNNIADYGVRPHFSVYK